MTDSAAGSGMKGRSLRAQPFEQSSGIVGDDGIDMRIRQLLPFLWGVGRVWGDLKAVIVRPLYFVWCGQRDVRVEEVSRTELRDLRDM